jgi:hypothetical protein
MQHALPARAPARQGAVKRHPARRVMWLAAVMGLVTSALGTHAWAGYNVWTGEYTLSKQELQTLVERRFPASMRYAQVLTVRLTRPRIDLNGGANRVTTHLDAQITNSMLPAPPINGSVALDSGIRYDAATRAVLMDNPNVSKVDLDGTPPQYRDLMNAIGNVVAQEVLKDYPLYTFTPEELHVGGKDVQPGTITVDDDGIRVKVDSR